MIKIEPYSALSGFLRVQWWVFHRFGSSLYSGIQSRRQFWHFHTSMHIQWSQLQVKSFLFYSQDSHDFRFCQNFYVEAPKILAFKGSSWNKYEIYIGRRYAKLKFTNENNYWITKYFNRFHFHSNVWLGQRQKYLFLLEILLAQRFKVWPLDVGVIWVSSKDCGWLIFSPHGVLLVRPWCRNFGEPQICLKMFSLVRLTVFNIRIYVKNTIYSHILLNCYWTEQNRI